MAKKKTGSIYIGVGGWTFDAWRDNFYPAGLTQKRELEYASQHLTSVEVNGTYYGLQKPATYQKWHDETPDNFVFSLKAPRYAMNRKVLAEAGSTISRFLASGIGELKDKLGPLNWQFLPTKKFEAADFEAFLKLLPKELSGRQLRHAVEVRHKSFECEEFVTLARKHGVAIVVSGDSAYPQIADSTAPFVYARIMGTVEPQKAGYSKQALDAWSARLSNWAEGRENENLKHVFSKRGSETPRDVYLYVISGFKAHNPAAAMGLIERL